MRNAGVVGAPIIWLPCYVGLRSWTPAAVLALKPVFSYNIELWHGVGPNSDIRATANEVIESSGNGTSRVLSRLIGSLSLLVAIFSPIEISQFQCPSPTELIQFHCPLVGALLLGGVHGFLLGNSRTGTLSIPAPRTVTEITRLSVRSFRPGQPLFPQNKQLQVPCCRRPRLGGAGH
jgi:hypothetical protein